MTEGFEALCRVVGGSGSVVVKELHESFSGLTWIIEANLLRVFGLRNGREFKNMKKFSKRSFVIVLEAFFSFVVLIKIVIWKIESWVASWYCEASWVMNWRVASLADS